jgi:sterol 3beta-glucosyltransferase
MLAAPARFAGLAEAHSLAFAPLPGDVTLLSRDFADRAGVNPIDQMRVIAEHGAAIAEELLASLREAARGADLIVHTFVTTMAGQMFAAEMGAREVSAQLFPFFAIYDTFPSVPLPAADLGAPLNRLTHRLSNLIFSLSGLAMYRAVRWRNPAIGPARPSWATPGERTPMLLAYSPLVVGPTPAAAPLARATGFWCLEAPEGYRPPPELEAFLDSGPRPVYVGFGSMATRDGPRLAAVAIEALGRHGLRLVLQRGWAGLGDGDLPKWAMAVGEVPHGWLLPRMAAVIHHGGAGTTAAALRAGVPSLTVPFTADQPFWGRRAHRLGVGPPPIPARVCTAEALAAALPALADPGVIRRAAIVGAALRAESGVDAAVRMINLSL